jgi:6,7-dimethyl-8-ribityllumazine synthase
MIKSLSITRRIYEEQDLRALSEFFEAIGLEHLPGDDKSWTAFATPVGKLLVNLISEKVSPQFRGIVKGWDRTMALETDDPETIWFAAHNRGYEILWDSISKTTGKHNFAIKLPGGLALTVQHSKEPAQGTAGDFHAEGKRFAVIVSRFNAFITERLLQGTIDGLTRSGANRQDIEIVRVPGAFEVPSAARTLAETKKYDAIICLGCLLRGDTAHYDVIVNEVTRGIGQSAQETGVPHAFGVLTCDTLEQAIDRAGLKMGNKGFEAALAAVEMANLKKAVVGRRSLVVGKSKTVARRASPVVRKNKRNIKKARSATPLPKRQR